MQPSGLGKRDKNLYVCGYTGYVKASWEIHGMIVGSNLNFLNLGYHTYVFCSSQNVSFGYFFVLVRHQRTFWVRILR